MATIEQTLQEGRQGTPYVYGKNKDFNKRMEKYTQGIDIDADTGYEYSKSVFNDILGEKVDKWVQSNKSKLEKMDSRKAMELYTAQVDKLRKRLKVEFPEDAQRVEDEYSRRSIAQEQADIAQMERDRVVSAGKLGSQMKEADQALLNDPDYVNPVGSTQQSIVDAQQRQSDLSIYKQENSFEEPIIK